ncbi:DeoR/GlpR family DNA-binding transcription regulator [Metabacillus sp. RGM 3146]|uniref:DeoR/GlpR family DNA-binding transcription regulator n=1 Tax=Metabacillus sp. RGM 3146 TaxID=3401092 RepID=UPI003B9C98D9
MHFVERHEEILKRLEQEKMVKVIDLSDAFQVTEKTIRQDLIALEKRGLLKRIYGGAVLTDNGNILPIAVRQQKYGTEKKSIAKAALSTIKEEDTILLDGGSTIMELAKLLGDFPITVITNDIKIGNLLMNQEKIQLLMLGGLRIPSSTTLYGPLAKNALERLRVNRLFLGTTGIDLQHGLTVFNSFHADYKKNIIEVADHITLLTDHTKFGQTALIRFADLQDIDEIITNDELNDRYKKRLNELQLPVVYSE